MNKLWIAQKMSYSKCFANLFAMDNNNVAKRAVDSREFVNRFLPLVFFPLSPCEIVIFGEIFSFQNEQIVWPETLHLARQFTMECVFSKTSCKF